MHQYCIAIVATLTDQHHAHQEEGAQAANAEGDADLPNRLWTIISTLEVTRAFAQQMKGFHLRFIAPTHLNCYAVSVPE